MTAPHPDLNHPSRRRRSFARFAMWFAAWQGTPTFVALLTLIIITELVWNQIAAPTLGLHQLVFDRNTWLLNLGLSLLASYASSLSVMGAKVQSDQILQLLADQRKEIAGLRRALDGRRGGEPIGETTDGGEW